MDRPQNSIHSMKSAAGSLSTTLNPSKTNHDSTSSQFLSFTTKKLDCACQHSTAIEVKLISSSLTTTNYAYDNMGYG